MNAGNAAAILTGPAGGREAAAGRSAVDSGLRPWKSPAGNARSTGRRDVNEDGNVTHGAAASEPERFSLSFPVLPGDIDANGHVNNVVYVRWVQDAATAHWNARTTDAEKLEVTWVVVRHEIDYLRAALPGDEIAAVTWVGPASRHSYERNTELRRAHDRDLLARARTIWCPLGPATGRPVRLGDDLRSRFSTGGRLRTRGEG